MTIYELRDWHQKMADDNKLLRAIADPHEAAVKAIDTAINSSKPNVPDGWEVLQNKVAGGFTIISPDGISWSFSGENHTLCAFFKAALGNAFDPQGTFACPICGQHFPHKHSSEEVAEHRFKKINQSKSI